MINIEGLCVISGGFKLSDINLRVERGEHVALMGRTGQGKTTILEAICGLRAIACGRIIMGGKDITHLPPAERGIGYVPQDLALFSTKTVRAHLEFALKLRGWDKQQRQARGEEVATWLGIERLLDRRVTTLSGGEAQRTAIGRALSFEPDVLLLDEPMSALDDTTRKELHAVIRTVRARTKVTTLHVTHNQSEAAALADRVLVLNSEGIQPFNSSPP